MSNKFIYLICPVNDVAKEEKEFLDQYVSSLETLGNKVHYPPRDVNQVDPTGTRILTEHRAAMREVTDVHAYLGQKTKGSYFDFGMAYMGEKPLFIVNLKELMTREFEDFDKFALNQSVNMQFWSSEAIYNLRDWAQTRKEEIRNAERIEYGAPSLDKKFFFDFGMAFYSGKPITLANRLEVEKLAVPGKKSFQNVLLELNDRYSSLV
jgi:hypothetical protein